MIGARVDVELVWHLAGQQDAVETLVLRDRDDDILVAMMQLIRRPDRRACASLGAGPVTFGARTPPAV